MNAAELILQRLDQIDRTLTDERKASSESRAKVYSRLEEMHVQMIGMGHRVETVEKSVASHAPTIAEYLQMKERVRGAGQAGQILWGLGGIILTIAAWLAGLPQMLSAWLKSF